MNENIDKHIGERIALARKLIGCSRNGLSLMTHIPIKRISLIEDGKTPVKAWELTRISDHLYRDFNWFFNDTPEEPIIFQWCNPGQGEA